MAPEPEAPRGRLRLFSGARTRVLASFVLLLALSNVAGLVALRQILLARTGERVDDALVQETGEFRRLAREGRDPRTGRPFGDRVEAIFDVFLSRNVPGEGEALSTFVGPRPYRVSSNSPFGKLAGIERAGRRAARTGGELEAPGGERVVYVSVPVRVNGRVRGAFVVSADLSGELEEVNQALEVAAGVSILVLLIAAGISWVVAGRVLAPLRDLSDTARSISESDLSRRIPARGNDEIADLARTFNAMLDRLEGAFAEQKAFVSDAGHELRTPITIIRGHLELLSEDPDERRETVELVTDELDRMSRFVDDLLLLAKAQRPDFLRVQPLRLDELTRDVFAKASALGDRQWSLEHVGEGALLADRQRLTQALVNLSQNAVQHTSPGDAIALGSRAYDGHVSLWVRDSGPGVAESERERIFERFARGDGARTSDGAGLGLSIVRAIAEAHGGRVELDSPVDAGARFTVLVPADSRPEEARA